jgi:hypothetical protein
LLLQSTTCWRTNIEPESRWARGAVFWLDSEAKVQIAPSGMMKKRKDGFCIVLTLEHDLVRKPFPLFGTMLTSALVIVGVTAKLFEVMSSIVSIVSWAIRISQSRVPASWR